METSLKTGFAQNFSRCPKNLSCPKIWGGCSPPRPPGPYAYDTVNDSCKLVNSSTDEKGFWQVRQQRNQQQKQSYTLFKGVNLEYRLPGIAIRQPLVARLPADVIIK